VFKISISNDITGQILAKKYQLISVLGAGGMGTVYKAKDILVDRVVAIKVLRADSHNYDLIRRFQREAKIAARIDHRNCLGLLDFGIDNDRPYLVMPFVDGRTLSAFIKQEHSVAPLTAVELFIQICEGLDAAHRMGVVHRDIKPSNIVLLESPVGITVKILDFGIAKLREPDAQSGATMTTTGELLGSPRYMSPEQCEGHPADERSDIYSLGILMYETLTGEPPFRDENVFAIIEKHRKEDPAPLFLSGMDNKLAKQLEAIVFKCLAKDPADRYQAISQLQIDLNIVSRQLQGLPAKGISIVPSKLARSKRIIAPNWNIGVVAVILLLVLSSTVPILYTPLFHTLPDDERNITFTPPDVLPVLNESEINSKDELYKLAASNAKNTYGKDSSELVDLYIHAGDFFFKHQQYDYAMKYFNSAAALLQRNNLGSPYSIAELRLKQARCCIQLKVDMGPLMQPVLSAINTFKLGAKTDPSCAVSLIESQCLLARIFLVNAAADRTDPTRWLKEAELGYKRVLFEYAVFKNQQHHQSLIPYLIETGDYFYDSAKSVHDDEHKTFLIAKASEAYRDAFDECDGLEDYRPIKISVLNKLGMIYALGGELEDAKKYYLEALDFLSLPGASKSDQVKVLYNLSDLYFSLHDYGSWIITRLRANKF
jgi:serine/threonine protein kinase